MITVKVPATSANCSVGFDTLGLALNWYSSITFEKSDELLISGCPREYATADNLVWTSFVFACHKCGKPVPNVHIDIQSDIPFARGLGSSSQCVVAGILGANAIAELEMDHDQLLACAVEIEGHPDNVAPALNGALSVTVEGTRSLIGVNLGANGWKALVVIPPYEVSTPMARKALPEEIPLHNAAMQAGRAMLFEYAWTHKDETLLFEACHDLLHEPSRSKLIAHYPAMQEIAARNSVSFWISGSGSTMLFVSQNKDTLQALKEEIKNAHPELDVRLSEVSEHGAEVIHG